MDNKALMSSLYDAFGRGDAETVLGAMAPDIDWREAETQPYAEGNPYIGPQRVAEGIFGRVLADFEDFTIHREVTVAEGDVVVTCGRYTGKRSTTGEPLDAQFVHVWTIRDGKVQRFQQYTDTAQLSRLVGA